MEKERVFLNQKQLVNCVWWRRKIFDSNLIFYGYIFDGCWGNISIDIFILYLRKEKLLLGGVNGIPFIMGGLVPRASLNNYSNYFELYKFLPFVTLIWLDSSLALVMFVFYRNCGTNIIKKNLSRLLYLWSKYNIDYKYEWNLFKQTKILKTNIKTSNQGKVPKAFRAMLKYYKIY